MVLMKKAQFSCKSNCFTELAAYIVVVLMVNICTLLTTPHEGYQQFTEFIRMKVYPPSSANLQCVLLYWAMLSINRILG